jgi:hypothetical protein
MGVFAPLVGIIGSTQAAEALKLICGVGESLTGRLLMLEGKNMEWSEMKLCAQHGMRGLRRQERQNSTAEPLRNLIWWPMPACASRHSTRRPWQNRHTVLVLARPGFDGRGQGQQGIDHTQRDRDAGAAGQRALVRAGRRRGKVPPILSGRPEAQDAAVLRRRIQDQVQRLIGRLIVPRPLITVSVPCPARWSCCSSSPG